MLQLIASMANQSNSWGHISLLQTMCDRPMVKKKTIENKADSHKTKPERELG
jgi:hypothetical protein